MNTGTPAAGGGGMAMVAGQKPSGKNGLLPISVALRGCGTTVVGT
jgi:hypothetical protein